MKSLILISFMLISSNNARNLELHLFENASDLGLVCNDGSPSGYYIDYAEQESNKWLFFQQGGGWCYDEASCLTRYFPICGYQLLIHQLIPTNW